jgi:hypothetical protein
VYDEEVKVEYSLEYEDSMEMQMVEFVHASTKKARDVKRSYGKKNRQLPLKVECLHGVVLYE